MGEEDFLHWAESKFTTEISKVHKLDNEEIVYMWSDDDTQGNAYFREGRLLRLSLFKITEQITFQQVVAGMGNPERLDRSLSTYDLAVVSFVLEYPSLGVSVSGFEKIAWRELKTEQGKYIFPVHESLPVESIHCYVPGTMETTLRDSFFVTPDNMAYHLRRRIAWPGFNIPVTLEE